MFYTYLYFNPVTDVPFYVGKGKGNRANTHLIASTNKQVNGYIRNLRAEDIEPTVEIIQTTNEVSAFWLERCLIAAYGRKDKATGCLFNHTDGGEGSSGVVTSLELRAKRSAAAKRAGLSGSHRKGHKLSAEHVAKIKASNILTAARKKAS